jgi:hypothetical protein
MVSKVYILTRALISWGMIKIKNDYSSKHYKDRIIV